mmetsp:Transcript_43140/g.101153  ORF Transcript_43140/g.101153 Transcript_43140/m.101153 type:complete len:143 (-) Transcript_43140:448-876(-)
MEIVCDDPGTIFNFLLGCGQYTLFAFSWPGSRPGSKVWNGLFYTIRNTKDCPELSSKDSVLEENEERVAVITTKPLTTNEHWVEMRKGELLLFDRGLPYSLASTCDAVEKAGRGLETKVKSMMRKDHDCILNTSLIPGYVSQ